MGRSLEKLFITKDMDETDAELVRHGIAILVCDGRAAAGILLSALVLGDVRPALYYITVFGMFRTSCGGWHAESERGCFAVSVTLYLVSFLLRMPSYPAWLLLSAEAVSAWCILADAPVQHIYQPLDAGEVRRCRIRSRILLGMLFLTQTVFLKDVQVMNTVILLFTAGSMNLLKHTRYWRGK